MNDDTRGTCTACQHYRASLCHNARLAQMSRTSTVAEVGTAFAQMPQHCHGFKAKEKK